MIEEQWLRSEDSRRMLRVVRGQEPREWDNELTRTLTRNSTYRPSQRQLRLIVCELYRLNRVEAEAQEPDRARNNAFVANQALEHGYRLADGQGGAFAGHPEDFCPTQADIYKAIDTMATSQKYHDVHPSGPVVLREVLGNIFRPVQVGTTISNPSQMSTQALQSGATQEWFAPPWLTGTVESLAQAAYEELTPEGLIDPARLLVLSDALEEAGCQEQAILQHLRSIERCGECFKECNKYWKDNPTPQIHDLWPPSFCEHCKGTGWRTMATPHVRGCWALDLLLQKEYAP